VHRRNFNAEDLAMELDNFLSHIERGEIPPGPPRCATGSDYPGYGEMSLGFNGRTECTKRGMWAIVEKQWVAKLAKWIGDRKCLEVMAGAGWLAKALDNHGVDITATDDYSWDGNQHSLDMERVYPVQQAPAIDAVTSTGADVLIISWPPYGSRDIIDICSQWGSERPVVYIGEEGGCNAPGEFFDNFEITGTGIHLPRWYGLHDQIMIGHYNG